MDRTRLLTGGFVALTALALAACSSASADTDIQRDLQQASLSTMEVAPAGSGRQLVSAIEQTPHGQSTPRPIAAHRPKTKTPAPAQVADQPREPAAALPTKPVINPPPPGGYKTMDQVLRQAPFPIKP